MSLKGFHIVFVIATVTLAVFFGHWSYGQYQLTQSGSYLWSTVGSGCAALGFIIYGVIFAKKIKE